jgi:hypothetical protein
MLIALPVDDHVHHAAAENWFANGNLTTGPVTKTPDTAAHPGGPPTYQSRDSLAIASCPVVRLQLGHQPGPAIMGCRAGSSDLPVRCRGVVPAGVAGPVVDVEGCRDPGPASGGRRTAQDRACAFPRTRPKQATRAVQLTRRSRCGGPAHRRSGSPVSTWSARHRATRPRSRRLPLLPGNCSPPRRRSRPT